MKVERNMTVFAGAEQQMSADRAEKNRQGRKTIFAGDLNGVDTLQDRIRQRKEQAQRDALKVVRDAWSGDQAIDQSLDESRQHIRDMQEENLQARNELNNVDRQREKLKEIYGVTDDTPLWDQPEEYRQRVSELNDWAKHNQEIIDGNDHDIKVENTVIRETELERLKKHPMLDAQETADEILKAAQDEIVGMVVDAAKDHLDEEQAKRDEQAEKLKEEKEELEEIQEKRKEREEELEELIEDIPVEEMVELDQIRSDVRREVQNIVDKMKLVAEDIKGAMVDTNA